jgi:hypothetical protein
MLRNYSLFHERKRHFDDSTFTRMMQIIFSYFELSVTCSNAFLNTFSANGFPRDDSTKKDRTG